MPGTASPSGGAALGAGRMAHAGQTMKNLTKAAGETMGGKIMGDYNASHGSFGGSMTQKLRAERLGMAEGGSESDHTGGQQSSGQSDGLKGTIRGAPTTNENDTQNQPPQATHNRTPSAPAASAAVGAEVPYRSPAGSHNDEQ